MDDTKVNEAVIRVLAERDRLRAERNSLRALVLEVLEVTRRDRFAPFLPSDMWIRLAEMETDAAKHLQFKAADLADPPGSG